jgi:hypothetical protein
LDYVSKRFNARVSQLNIFRAFDLLKVLIKLYLSHQHIKKRFQEKLEVLDDQMNVELFWRAEFSL